MIVAKRGWYIPFIFLILSLSYNFHELWLLYDLAILAILFRWCLKGSKKKVYSIILLAIFISCLNLLIHKRFDIMFFLSIWDTYKHLVILMYMYYCMRSDVICGDGKLRALLYKIAVALFFLNLLFTTYQWLFVGGIELDNISGFFGYKATHALGFLSLVVLLFVFFDHELSKVVKAGVYLLVLYQNLISENYGVIILSSILLVGVIIFFSRHKHKVFYVLAMILITFAFEQFLGKYFHEIANRALNYFELVDMSLIELKHPGRNMLTYYAYMLGGIWGAGPGVYSDIYGLDGAYVSTLLNSEVNISELSHLIAEYGVFGYCLTMLIYFYFISYFFVAFKVRMYLCFLLFLFSMYNRVFMDERIAFFACIILCLFAVHYEASCVLGKNKFGSARGLKKLAGDSI